MNRVHTPEFIAGNWLDDVERALEFGDSPVLELGAGNSVFESTATLLAMQDIRLLQIRYSPFNMPAGGLGYAWLAALLQQPKAGASYWRQEISYSGANLAEYMTSVSLMQARLNPVDLQAGSRTVIPASHFYTQAHPGKALLWDSFPFEQISTALPGEEYASPASSDTQGVLELDPIADWMAWISLLLALCLIVLAIIL